MKKTKVVVLPLLSLVLLGITFYTTDASENQDVNKGNSNIAEMEYKEMLDKSRKKINKNKEEDKKEEISEEKDKNEEKN